MDAATGSLMNPPAALRRALVPLLIFTILSGSPARAGDAAEGAWEYVLEPYIMFPNMQGTVGLGNHDGPVDEDPGDIFSNLEMGAMLYAEANNGSWAFSSDLLYMKLGADVQPRGILDSGEVEVAQVGWELAAMRRVSPWLELGVAAVYNSIEAELNLVFIPLAGMTPVIGRKTDQDWIDPVLVARVTHDLNDKWFLHGRGNIGGFGVGSDLTWQIQLDAGYRFSDRAYMTLGYRVIDIDYAHGSGADRFVYDMSTFGPQLRFGFRF